MCMQGVSTKNLLKTKSMLSCMKINFQLPQNPVYYNVQCKQEFVVMENSKCTCIWNLMINEKLLFFQQTNKQPKKHNSLLYVSYNFMITLIPYNNR